MNNFNRSLLKLGAISSVYYVAINVLVPFGFEGYSIASQTVSELSAIDAPTRILWVPLASLYIIMFGGFAWGVWSLSQRKSNMRTVGVLMLTYAFVNLYWPPMHLRGQVPTLTDTLHIIWAMVTVGLMMAMMILGRNLFGKTFRYFTFGILAVHVVFGTLTAIDGPNIAHNLPTPWIGVWERINIAAFMLWVAVLSVQLSQNQTTLKIVPKMRTESV